MAREFLLSMTPQTSAIKICSVCLNIKFYTQTTPSNNSELCIIIIIFYNYYNYFAALPNYHQNILCIIMYPCII